MKNLNKHLRVGIIGLGTVAKTHILALQEIENVTIVAVADIKPKEELTIPENARYYASYIQMLDQEELDSVHICLPHYLHFSAAIACINKGIPTLCEKPITMNYQEVVELVQEVKKHDALLAVCLQNRWNNTFLDLKRLIQSGDYGNLEGIKGIALWDRPKSYYEKAPWRGDISKAGGGCLINQAVHTLDQMLQLGGEVEKVKAVMTNLTDFPISVEDSAMINIQFKNGSRALCIASNANFHNASIELEVICEKAIFRIKDFTLYKADRKNEFTFTSVCQDKILPGTKSYYGVGHRYLIQDYYKHLIDTTQGQYVSAADAGQVIGLVDLVSRSANEQREIYWKELMV